MTKKILLFASVFALSILNAQEPKNINKKNEFSFSSIHEKEIKIKEFQDRLTINISDPTFPKDELGKQKQQLKKMKLAKINPTTK